MQTAINGKANASHTHSYLPLSGGTLTGDLTVKGYFNGEKVYYTIWTCRDKATYQLYRFGRFCYTAGPIIIDEGWAVGSNPLGTIPVGYRPAFAHRTAAFLVSGNNDYERMIIGIETDGTVVGRALSSDSIKGKREFVFSSCWLCSYELPS